MHLCPSIPKTTRIITTTTIAMISSVAIERNVRTTIHLPGKLPKESVGLEEHALFKVSTLSRGVGKGLKIPAQILNNPQKDPSHIKCEVND